ncbi:zinc finger protein 468-like [Hetaerina americana]|uniref:zinc finger protein 468-like n=1 Tax=Hetaerina americana TaxID=62018 RepID=UPI003A7F1A5E
MSDKSAFEVCRLCLNSRGLLINVFGENSQLQSMLEKTIEDLINIKVVVDANYPWLVCSNCMEKLTEFQLFKRRCAECMSVFYNCIQKGCNPAAKYGEYNREESPDEIKKELYDNPIVSDANVKSSMGIPDDVVKQEEVDAASECSASPLKDIESIMAASMKEGCSHWSDNVDGNMYHSQGDELRLSINKEVVIKEKWNVNVSQEKEGLEVDASMLQDYCKGQDSIMTILHRCQICNKGFTQKDILEAHMLRFHPVKVAEIRSGIESHTFECTSDVEADVVTYKCAVCLKAFSQKYTLKRHMRIHAGQRPYECEICFKGFNHKQHLEGHMLAHTGERPHKCETCTKTFALKHHLKDHIRIHSRENLHKCEVCSKEFNIKQNLKRHMLIHTGEFPHKCDICLKGFHHRQHLEGHMWTHTGERPYKCDVCQKTFTLRQSLKVHMYIHTG